MRKDITVLGQEGLGIVYAGASSMKSGNYMSEHDQLISEKLGYVLSGGDLSQLTEVSEKYLLTTLNESMDFTYITDLASVLINKYAPEVSSFIEKHLSEFVS